MGTSEIGSIPGPPAAGDETATASPLPVGDHLSPRRVWAMALMAGVAAGLVSWLVGELARDTFQARKFKVQVLLQTFIQPTTQSQNEADLKNTTLSFSILGLTTGLMLGLAGGLAGRSARRGGVVGLGAGAAGALVGSLASRALLPAFHRQFVPNPNDLYTPVMIHGGIWSAIGAVCGAAFALGTGSGRHIHAAFGGLIGALVATVLFHAVGTSFFPDAGFADMAPASPYVRLLARFLITALIAVGAARGLLGKSHKPLRPLDTLSAPVG